MKKIKILASLTAIMGIISFVCFLLARFALTDIFHGEPDVVMEWQVISLSFLPILVFHIMALLTVLNTLGFLRTLEN